MGLDTAWVIRFWELYQQAASRFRETRDLRAMQRKPGSKIRIHELRGYCVEARRVHTNPPNQLRAQLRTCLLNFIASLLSISSPSLSPLFINMNNQHPSPGLVHTALDARRFERRFVITLRSSHFLSNVESTLIFCSCTFATRYRDF
jgi:hypothetical protein